MATFLLLIPSIVTALVGVGLQLWGIQSPLLGKSLIVIAGILAIIGLWPWLRKVWFWLRRIRLRWPVYVPPTEAELSRRREDERIGKPVIKNRPPGASQDTAQLKERIEDLEAENKQLRSQPGDEELKQRSYQLANELYEFLEEYSEKDPRYTMWPNVGTNDTDPESQRRLDEYTQETMRHNDFAMRQYSRRFGGKVVALVGHLKQRGWWNPEEPQKLDNPVHPIDVRRIADHLSAIGHS